MKVYVAGYNVLTEDYTSVGPLEQGEEADSVVKKMVDSGYYELPLSMNFLITVEDLDSYLESEVQ